MLVVDASALAEYLIGSPRGREVAEHLLAHDGSIHTPHLCGAEVVSTLRSLVARGGLDEYRARRALDLLVAFPTTRYPSEPLVHRIWELRHNLSAYDAHYVALAEAIGAPILTCDAKIERAPGHNVMVTTVE